MRFNIKVMILCILTLFIVATNVNAENLQEESGITVFINEELMEFEVDPVLVNGTTLVQFRPIFEKLGYSVKWEEKTKRITAERNEHGITMTIGNSIGWANNFSYFLSEDPQIRNGFSIVPLRFIAEASGAIVTWEEETRQIHIRVDRNEAPELKIDRLIESYACSNSAYEFVSAITRSIGTKCNGYVEVVDIELSDDRKHATIHFILDYWVNHPSIINAEFTDVEYTDISVEVKHEVISDSEGNWYFSPELSKREYHVTLK